MKRTSGRPRTFHLLLSSLILIWLQPHDCFSQLENPVYVDDSPLAWEMFQRAQDQAHDNVAEAVRLYQELLDDYGGKLIPVAPAETDRLYSVRSRVLADLRANDELLSRYQLIESAEAERLLAAHELRRLVTTRSLTAPGLDALLRLGQRELEAAHFRAAMSLLREAAMHPRLTEATAAHVQFMTGMAAHYLSDTAALNHAREQLTSLGRVGEPFLIELDRLAAQQTVNGPMTSVSPVDSGTHFELDDLVAQEIWSKELTETILRRRYSDAAIANRDTTFGIERRRRTIDIVTVAAAATDNAVYVNEGHLIHAFDRFTGYDIWAKPFRERFAVTITDPDTDGIGDLNLISVEGDALVTLTGHADADGRSSNGQILCLDAGTGESRWATDVDHMLGNDEYEGLFPFGEPVIAEGRVYCLARKQSTQTLTATYLVALDLTNGEPVWVRHIASSALIRMRNTRPFSSPVFDKGDLLVSTSVGAVACIDAATGEIKWLRVHRPPITESPQPRQPYELTGPAVTLRGVLAIQPDERRVMLLDRTTGQMLESYPIGTHDGWGAPKYLLADDRFVFAIGSDVRAFSADNLERPLWQIPSVKGVTSNVENRALDLPSLDDDLEVAGRVQLTSGALIVPTSRGLMLVDPETGHEEQRLSMKSVVVPLAVDGQVFVAGADYLDAYMPMGTAERILRERLAARPDDVEPALSLLRLGIRVRQLDLVLEAAALTHDMLSSQQPMTESPLRAALFDMLLEAARLGLAEEAGEGTSDQRVTAGGERLHAMLRTVAVTPEQQVEQLLAYGAWCAAAGANEREQHRLADAVEAYQTILDHPLLARTERDGESSGHWAVDADGRDRQGFMPLAQGAAVSKSAMRWAIDRLDALIEAHGRRVYEPQEDYARMELARLEQSGSASIAALRNVAMRFPFASAAGEAAVRASQMLAESGLKREALALLSGVMERVPVGQQPAATRVMGEMVMLSESLGWREHAKALLRAAEREMPGEDLVLATGTRDPGAWLELLGAETERAVRAGRQRGPAEALAGVVVLASDALRDGDSAAGGTVRFGELDSGNGRVVLLQSHDTLRALKLPRLEEAWTQHVGTASLELLGVHDGAAVLWQRSPAQDPRAMAIDLSDGRVRWTTPSVDQLDRDAVDQIRRDRSSMDLMPNGLPLNPAEVLAYLTDEKVMFVRRTGEVFAVDLRLGEPIVTLAKKTIEEVHEAHVTDFGVVLVGRSVPLGGRAVGSERVPVIALVSRATGEILLRVEPTGAAGVIWSALTGLGELVYGTDAGVEMMSLHTGERVWRQHGSAGQATRRGWVMDRNVLVETSAGSLRAIALETGAMSEPFYRPTSALGGSNSLLVDVVRDRDRIFAQFADRIVRVTEDGAVQGKDAISDERDYRKLFPAEDRYVLLSKVGTQQVRDTVQQVSKTKHYYRIYSLSANGALLQEGSDLEPLDESIRDAVLVDGWLMLSTGTATFAVPMPVNER